MLHNNQFKHGPQGNILFCSLLQVLVNLLCSKQQPKSSSFGTCAQNPGRGFLFCQGLYRLLLLVARNETPIGRQGHEGHWGLWPESSAREGRRAGNFPTGSGERADKEHGRKSDERRERQLTPWGKEADCLLLICFSLTQLLSLWWGAFSGLVRLPWMVDWSHHWFSQSGVGMRLYWWRMLPIPLLPLFSFTAVPQLLFKVVDHSKPNLFDMT